MPGTSFTPTINAIRDRYTGRIGGGDPLAAELSRVLALLPPDTDLIPALPAGARHPITRHLDAALAPGEGKVETVLAPLRRIASALAWRYSYAARADAPGLEERVAWSEFIGPVAPIVSDRVCLGITLIAPRTLYPLHHHPAIETYFVLSGTAIWTAAGKSRHLPPGSFILHPSNVEHAMQAGDEPLLAAYTWSGDVHSPSVYD